MTHPLSEELRKLADIWEGASHIPHVGALRRAADALDEAAKARNSWKLVALERQTIKADYARVLNERDALECELDERRDRETSWQETYRELVTVCQERDELRADLVIVKREAAHAKACLEALSYERDELRQIANNWRDAADRQKSMVDTANRDADEIRRQLEDVKARQ